MKAAQLWQAWNETRRVLPGRECALSHLRHEPIRHLPPRHRPHASARICERRTQRLQVPRTAEERSGRRLSRHETPDPYQPFENAESLRRVSVERAYEFVVAGAAIVVIALVIADSLFVRGALFS